MSKLFLHRNIYIPLNQSDQMDFVDETAQKNFFRGSGHVWKTYENFNFIKANYMCCIPETYIDLINAGIRYASYELTDGGKVYYCFVTRFEWVSANSTNIYLTIDPFQTFLFNYSLRDSLINTQHLQGSANILTTRVEQSAGVNNYVDMSNTVNQYSPFTNNDYYMVASACDLQNSGGTSEQPVIKTSKGAILDGGFSGLSYYLVRSNEDATFMSMLEFLNRLADLPWVASSIVDIVLLPEAMVNLLLTSTANVIDSITFGGSTKLIRKITIAGFTTNLSTTITFGSVINSVKAPNSDYCTRCRQLTHSPYTQIELLLYNGNNVILQPELFDGNDNGDKAISFAVIFHIAPQPVIYIAPVNYDGQAVNYEHCLVFSSFPHYQCSINNGALALAQNTNSLSQQRANMSAVQGLNARLSGLQKQGVNNQLALGNFQRSMQIVGDVAGGLGSLVTGNVGGALSAGVNAFATYASGGYYQQQAQIDKASIDAQLALTNQNIANSYKLAVANVKDAQIVPPTITGLSAGDTFILSVAKKIPFLIVKFKQAPAQEMLNIYNYFKNYGLQVNSFAVPNRTYRNGKARNKLNYVQLETVNIIGNIPESYINELQQIYKNGVTIWHCPEWQFLDYNFEANE